MDEMVGMDEGMKYNMRQETGINNSGVAPDTTTRHESKKHSGSFHCTFKSSVDPG